MSNFNIVEIDNESLTVKSKSASSEITIDNVAVFEFEQYAFSVNTVKGITNNGDKSLWISIDGAQWREIKPNHTILENVNMQITAFKIRSEFGIVPFSARGLLV